MIFFNYKIQIAVLNSKNIAIEIIFQKTYSIKGIFFLCFL